MEFDKLSKQGAGPRKASRQAGSLVSNTVVAGSYSSNTAGTNSSINAVAAYFRFISINYNFHPLLYSAALV